MSKDKEKKLAKEQRLLEAARLGDLQQLEACLSQLYKSSCKKKSNPLASLRKNVGPNSMRDPVTGFTCLHHAALNGHSDCVQLILDYGAKLNAVDYKGSSALHLAAWAGNLEVVRNLLSPLRRLSPKASSAKSANEQAEPNSASEWSQQAAFCSSSAKEQQVDIDLCNNDNQTPLSLAAQFGHTLVVAELLAHNANPEIRNNRLESPLDLACLNGRIETVELLLTSSNRLLSQLRLPRSTVTLSPRWAALKQGRPEVGRSTGSGSSGNEESASAGTSGWRQGTSGGWSSLLRGNRRNSSSNSQQQQQQHQSPPMRLTSVSLSMRDTSPTKSGLISEQSSVESQSGKIAQSHRAMLALTSKNNNASQQLQQRPMFFDKWMGDRAAVQHQQQSLQIESKANSFCEEEIVEKLLDHSPLHYAIRRGHARIVIMLLDSFDANILQITTLGSLLHEIALNNGKHSDMIGLLFSHIAKESQPAKRKDLLDKFLNLKNSQQRNVFEVLNEINNRSAQEMKRSIYEFSERMQSIQANVACPLAEQQEPSAIALAHQKQHSNPQQQQQQQLATQTLANTSQRSTIAQFSDIRQINSFITLKRVPVDERRKNCGSEQGVLSTQTIDRRINGRQTGSSSETALRPETTIGHPIDIMAEQENKAPVFDGQDAPISRSVSNINKMFSDGFASNLNAQVASDTLKLAQQEPFIDPVTRKQRSKSRDLGSLMKDAHQQWQHQVTIRPQSNEPNPSSSPFENVHINQMNQLVRSQTDCSHLMSRFYGIHEVNGQQGVYPRYMAPNHEREMINRHYHVYDHEFYPPRLLAQQPNQSVAVVAPLTRALDQSMRSDISSNRGVQSNMGTNQGVNCNDRYSLGFSDVANLQYSQHSKDRFLARHSKKMTVEPDYMSISVDQKRRDMSQNLYQKDAQTELNLGPANMQHMLSNSLSLESHLSEPHLFETTRRAIMNDFDRLIGQELLNRNHQDIIDCSTLPRDLASTNMMSGGSSQSILTGVMLDMDGKGENITVSGTRLVMPPEPTRHTIIRSEVVDRSAQTLFMNQNSSVSSGTQTSASDLEPTIGLPVLERNASIEEQARARADSNPERAYKFLGRSQTVNTTCQPSASPHLPHNSARAAFPKPTMVKPPRPPSIPTGYAIASSAQVDNHPNRGHSSNSSSSSASSSQNAANLVRMSTVTGSASPSTSQHNSGVLTVARPSALTLCASDVDSGVCTSNSLASLSLLDAEVESQKDQSKAIQGPPLLVPPENQDRSSAIVVRQMVRPPRPAAPNKRALSLRQQVTGEPLNLQGAPPSPSTAQLCLEEVFSMTAEPRGNSQTSSELFCSHSSASSERLPQVEVEKATAKPDESDKVGYENCRGLQIQLGTAANIDSDQRHLMPHVVVSSDQSTPSASSASSCLSNCLEDDDYAESASSSVRDASSSDSSSNCSNSSDKQSHNRLNAKLRKEIMLKVMIDESELSQNEEDRVFYVDPLELKKLDSKRSKADAETMTDEELHASIDKDSSYIRFTLRKKRNNMQSNAASQTELEEERSETSLELIHDAKKKRLIEDGKQAIINNLNRTTLKTRSNSEMSADDIHVNNARLGQVPKQMSLHVGNNPHEDQNNNARISQKPLITFNRQSATKLELWFSSNLVALTDYLVKFLQNGLDNVQYLNHPKLTNDDILRFIGIDNESHRMLIIERIRSELNPVDFDRLVTGFESTDLRKVLNVLQMDHLKLDDQVDCVQNLRMRSEDLPLGYRTRLLEFLNALARRNEQSRESSLARGQSCESNDISMDATSSSTSSSSKDSIKSMVSKEARNKQHPVTEKKVEPAQPAIQLKNNQESMTEKLESNKDQQEVDEQVVLAVNKRPQIARPASLVKTNNSLVGEVARKLEEAAAAQANQLANAKAQLRPVAAVRRKFGIKQQVVDSTTQQQQQKQPQEQLHHQRTPITGKNSLGSSPTTGFSFVPVKSVCWPPTQEVIKNKKHPANSVSSSNSIGSSKSSSTNSIVIGKPQECPESTKVSDTITDQTIDDGSMINSVAAAVIKLEPQTARRTRSKPAPPVKPAKLREQPSNASST